MSFDRRVERNLRNSNLAHLQSRGESNIGAERLKQHIAAGGEIKENQLVNIPLDRATNSPSQDIFDTDDVEVQNQEITSRIENLVKSTVEQEKKKDSHLTHVELLAQLAREQGGQRQNIATEDTFLDGYMEEVQEEIRDRMQEQSDLISGLIEDPETLEIFRNIQDIANDDQDSDIPDMIPQLGIDLTRDPETLDILRNIQDDEYDSS